MVYFKSPLRKKLIKLDQVKFEVFKLKIMTSEKEGQHRDKLFGCPKKTIAKFAKNQDTQAPKYSNTLEKASLFLCFFIFLHVSFVSTCYDYSSQFIEPCLCRITRENVPCDNFEQIDFVRNRTSYRE